MEQLLQSRVVYRSKAHQRFGQKNTMSSLITLIWLLGTRANRGICLQISQRCLRIELYNMLKWPSEGTGLSRKINTFVRAHKIYDIFAFIGHAAFRIDDAIWCNDFHMWPNASIDTWYIFVKALKTWRDRLVFSIGFEFKNG